MKHTLTIAEYVNIDKTTTFELTVPAPINRVIRVMHSFGRPVEVFMYTVLGNNTILTSHTSDSNNNAIDIILPNPYMIDISVIVISI